MYLQRYLDIFHYELQCFTQKASSDQHLEPPEPGEDGGMALLCHTCVEYLKRVEVGSLADILCYCISHLLAHLNIKYPQSPLKRYKTLITLHSFIKFYSFV